MVSIIDRLSTVENKMKIYDDALSKHSIQINDLKNSNIKCGINSDESTVAVNTSLNDTKTFDLNIEDDDFKQGNKSGSVNNIVTPGIVRKNIEKLNQLQHPKISRRHSFTATTNSKELCISAENNTKLNNDGFIEVLSKSERRRRQRQQVSSNNPGYILKGAPPPKCEIFVSRVIDGTEECITRYLIDRKIDVLDIRKVSHLDSKFKSFKVSVYKNDLNTLLNESFWPIGFKTSIWKKYSTHESKFTETVFNSSRQFNANRSNRNRN